MPLLAKRGFRGEIITTSASRELARLVMLDAAHLLEEDARHRARRGGHGGANGDTTASFYSTLDALNCLDNFGRTATYAQALDVTAGVKATFIDAGHILGSASIFLQLAEESHSTSVLFSGDLGNTGRVLLRSPATPPRADNVVMETTYGDRLHKSLGPSIDELFEAITETFKRGGNVIIPTFALERAQELLYFLKQGISTGRLAESTQVFLDSPKAEWLWEYAQDRDILVHIHPPLVAIGAVAMQQYRLNEALGRPFDTALSAARMIFSGVFDRYPKLKVLFVHMGGAVAPVICRLDWNWELNYHGIAHPPIQKVDKNVRKPSEYFKSNIYVDCMGPSSIALKAMIETCGIDRVLFGSDFGPVPMSPKLHVDLINDTIADAGDREKIFSANAVALLRLPASAPRVAHQVA